MKMIDKDPFSSGTEFMMWEARNCDRCWKSSHIKRGSDPDNPDYTPIICAIQRDIFTRMITDKQPISRRSYDICRKSDCPYRRKDRPKYEKHSKEPKLFED